MKQCGVKIKHRPLFELSFLCTFTFEQVAELTQKLSWSRGTFIFSALLTEKKYWLKFLHYQTRLFVLDFFLNACCVSRLIKRTESYH